MIPVRYDTIPDSITLIFGKEIEVSKETYDIGYQYLIKSVSSVFVTFKTFMRQIQSFFFINNRSFAKFDFLYSRNDTVLLKHINVGRTKKFDSCLFRNNKLESNTYPAVLIQQ